MEGDGPVKRGHRRGRDPGAHAPQGSAPDGDQERQRRRREQRLEREPSRGGDLRQQQRKERRLVESGLGGQTLGRQALRPLRVGARVGDEHPAERVVPVVEGQRDLEDEGCGEDQRGGASRGQGRSSSRASRRSSARLMAPMVAS